MRAAVAKLQEWLGGEPLRPLEEWHDDHGTVLWWNADEQGAPLQEPPWHIGCPLDTDWPDVADSCRFWAPLPRVRGPKES